MPDLILPASVKYNLERERLVVRHEALRWFDTELKALDPDLDLVKAHDNAGAPGIQPGFWHVRHTDPVTRWQTYKALRGPTGEFSEPHSGHLEKLREQDLRRPGAFKELTERWDREDEARLKTQAWQRAELKQEFLERYQNLSRPSVSFADVKKGWRNRGRTR